MSAWRRPSKLSLRLNLTVLQLQHAGTHSQHSAGEDTLRPQAACEQAHLGQQQERGGKTCRHLTLPRRSAKSEPQAKSRPRIPKWTQPLGLKGLVWVSQSQGIFSQNLERGASKRHRRRKPSSCFWPDCLWQDRKHGCNLCCSCCSFSSLSPLLSHTHDQMRGDCVRVRLECSEERSRVQISRWVRGE